MKVLLVDADLRQSKLSRILKIPTNPGLTNIIGGLCTLEEAINHTQYPNLDIICAGVLVPNPAEMLARETVPAIFDKLGEMYDFIIIDTAPVNVVSDALPIAKFVDGVVLISKQMESKHSELEKAISSLEFIDAKIIGLILNAVENQKKTRYYKSKRSKYGYGYGYGYGNSGEYGYGYGYGYGNNNQVSEIKNDNKKENKKEETKK